MKRDYSGFYLRRVRECEKIMGPRGQLSKDKIPYGIIKRWVSGQCQVPYAIASEKVLAHEAWEAYNDLTGEKLIALSKRFKKEPDEPKKGLAEFRGIPIPKDFFDKPPAVNDPMQSKTEESKMPIGDKVAPDVKLDKNQKQAAVLELLGKLAGNDLDEDRVRAIAKEEAKLVQGPAPIEVKIQVNDKEVKTDVGIQHKLFPLLLKVINSGIHVALVGPAGTGKTSASHSVAKALKLAYECQSFSATTTKADLLGFIDANGNYRDTPFRRAYLNGGIWVGDEFDAGNANANVVINAATADGMCAFPDGMKDRNKDFKVIICMNTYGQGADRQYVGRNQLDAATMDRFAFIRWDIDTGLEASMVGVKKDQHTVNIAKGGALTAVKWLERVSKVRSACEALNVRHLVTPRASMYGVRLFAAGIGVSLVEEMILWKGLDVEQRKRVEEKAK